MSFPIHPNTTLILGPPGTGKTTSLLNIVEEKMQTVEPSRIAFVSFTRKAAHEAAERARARFPQYDDPWHFGGFRTLHSLAYSRLGLTPQSIFNRKHCIALGKQLGMYIGGVSMQAEAQEAISSTGLGTELMFLDNLSRVRCESLETTWGLYGHLGSNVRWPELIYFSNRFTNYKAEHHVIDFSDMLVEYSKSKEIRQEPFEVLIVDEAQDLMQLQWEIVALVASSPACKEVFIAGDDDQAIYQWSGAAVETFLELQFREKRVLDKSYRLPARVYDMACNLVGRIHNRFEKEWSPRAEQGSVQEVTSIEDLPLAEGQWLFLARNNVTVEKICTSLRTLGWNYVSRNFTPYDKDLPRDIRAWERLRNGEQLHVREVRRIYERMRVGKGYKRGYKHLDQLDVNIVDMEHLLKEGGLLTTAIWYDAFTGTPEEEIAYLRAVLRRGEKIDSPRITVGTIHSMKGGEADNVVLYRDITYRTSKNLEDRADEEARVFYVGITRAKHNLYLMTGDSRYHYYF